MASTSTSASLPTHLFKHDVFLSFRGEDTRCSFISHLHYALCQKSIRTFIDNELERGEEISQELLNGIEESMFAVVVFSEGYASSRWCLDELAKIVECIDTRGQKVIPVFYHVDPSDVRKQVGTFADAFVGHEANFNSNIERLQRWSAALTKAVNLSGWATQDCGSESDIVHGIVHRIWKDLQKTWPSPLKGLVGIGPHIEQLQTLLLSGSSGSVFILGLWGMGGIGKTTIAKALFGQIKCRFDRWYFLANVREESEKCGLEKLGKKLLSGVLEEKIKTINMPDIGPFFYMRRDKKVLLVLDDVDDRKQLEYLAGDRGWYSPGSRIIITSRDRQLLKPLVDVVYKVESVLHPDALQLFSLHAFKHNVPTYDMRELSSLVVRYAKGVPLALKVLGSSLLDKSKREWESTLKKLKNAPNKEIQAVLKISYSSLDKEQKELFLWIACCLKGRSKDLVVELLNDCGISTEIGLSVLVDKSLITLFNYQNVGGSEYEGIRMHDLLQEMGREIVREESEDPGERRWLWNHEDIYQVFRGNSGTKKIKGISLKTSNMKEVQLHPDTFARMWNLKFLKINAVDSNYKVRLPKGINAFPDELRYLRWDGYPLESLPANPNLENLIRLELPNSKITELFCDKMQVMGKLKIIDLSGCGQLCKVSNLSRAPNVIRLNVRGCGSLCEVSSICHLSNVTRINLSDCPKLRSLPDLSDLNSLTRLDLNGCSNLETFPKVPRSTTILRLRGTAIKEVPSASVEYLENLVKLDMADCSQLESLSINVDLNSLVRLDLNGCSNLKTFPKVPRSTTGLGLRGTAIKEVPLASVEYLDNLVDLDMADCSQLESLPSNVDLKSLERLNFSGCSALRKFPEISKNLRFLYLSETAITEVPASVVCLRVLRVLSLKGCAELRILPSTIWKLHFLEVLCLDGCSNLTEFPQAIEEEQQENSFLGRLRDLNLSDCNLPKLPTDLGRLYSLKNLRLRGNSFKTIPASIKQLPWLETLYIAGCKSLQSIPELPQNLLRLKASGCTSLETVSAAFTRLAFGSTNYTRQCLFNFAGCLKLDEKECGDMVCDLRTNFISNGHRYKAFGATLQVSITYMGSNIPGWISHQSVGDSISFEFPSNWLNDGLLGFALGFIYKPRGIAGCTYHYFEYECHIGDKHLSRFPLSNPDHDLTTHGNETEHVFVTFDGELCDVILRNARKSQFCHDVFLLKFRCGNGGKSQCSCKIKMCGVIPFYAQGQGYNTL